MHFCELCNRKLLTIIFGLPSDMNTSFIGQVVHCETSLANQFPFSVFGIFQKHFTYQCVFPWDSLLSCIYHSLFQLLHVSCFVYSFQ